MYVASTEPTKTVDMLNKNMLSVKYLRPTPE